MSEVNDNGYPKLNQATLVPGSPQRNEAVNRSTAPAHNLERAGCSPHCGQCGQQDAFPRPARATRTIRLGHLHIGQGHPVVVQSMTNTDTRDVPATLAQIKRLAAAGCELVRLAVLDEAAAGAIREIRAGLEREQLHKLPLVADIHFDYRLALASLEAGVDGLRINPGNIGGTKAIDALVDAAKDHGAPIRIGVNSGSLEKELLGRFGGPTPEAMVESALGHVRLLEERNFDQIKISLKSSLVLDTVRAYRLLAERCDYPLHIGVTEAGPGLRGAVKSSVGIGLLLADGIGDTLRVSLTDSPEAEMTVAWEILRALGLRRHGAELISCPTCGRTEIDLIGIACLAERKLNELKASGRSDLAGLDDLKLAVMGCVVNGPGEAREADIGMAGGRDKAHIFRKGKIVRTLRGAETDPESLLAILMEEVEKYLAEQSAEQQSS